MSVHVHVSGHPDQVLAFTDEFLGSRTISDTEIYRPVEGSEVRVKPFVAHNLAVSVDLTLVVELFVRVGTSTAGHLAAHLIKAAGRDVLILINGRKVESEKDAIGLLRQAHDEMSPEHEPPSR